MGTVTLSATANFESAGDTDWFKVHLIAGRSYSITDNAVYLGKATSLQLFAPDGQLVQRPFSYLNQLDVVAPTTGDYFISAHSLAGLFTDTIQVQDLGIVAIPGWITTPVNLAIGTLYNVPAAVDAQSGSEWFGVDLVAGQSYVFATSTHSSASIVDANGKLLYTDSAELVHFTPTQSGHYFATLDLQTGGNGYDVLIKPVFDDYSDSSATVGSLAVDGSTSGIWETGGDSDWFAVTLEAGASYDFAVSSSDADPSLSPFVEVADANGSVIFSAKNSGLGATSATLFSPPASGTYYVAASIGVKAFIDAVHGNANDLNYHYTISATAVPLDLPDNVSTTGTVTVGSTTASTFERGGDSDWFAVSLVQGQSYEFANNAPALGSLALYDGGGHLIVVTSQYNNGSSVHHTAESTGIYYLAASAGSSIVGPHNYTVSVAEDLTDDFADNSGSTGHLTVDGPSVAGALSVPSDRDWFAVDLLADHTYVIGLSAYVVRDAAGNALTEANWGDRSFTPQSSGTFYIEVQGYNGTYTVDIKSQFDDYAESVNTAGAIRLTFSGDGSNETFDAGAYGANLYPANLLGNDGDDTLTGTTLGDWITGGNGNDTLFGGLGDDSLVGSAGVDIAVFDGNRSQYAIAYSGGGNALVSGVDGVDRVLSVERLQFDDVTIRLVDPSRFTLDGNLVSDVAFRDSSGKFSTWVLAGASALAGGGDLGNPGTFYSLVAAGDFNGNGKSDLLFRGRDGGLASWQIVGTAITGGGNIGNPGAAWSLAGTGDFNSDGRTDLLFLNGLTGDYANWNLSGTAIIGGGTIGNPSANWVFKATGDFNGDGRSEVLFESTNGGYATWTLNSNGTSVTGATLANPGQSWFFKGVGDFNGDGKTDILFENTSGSYGSWDVDGSTILKTGGFGNPGETWSLAAIGDYNGDGKSDLMFRNIDGTLATWTINDTAVVVGGGNLGNPGADFSVASGHGANSFADLVFAGSDGIIATWVIGAAGANVSGATLGDPGANWTALATADFVGTGETDILFQDADGTLATWKSDGRHLIGGGEIGNPGAGWSFKAAADFNGDGKADVLFQNSDGTYATWDVADHSIIGGGNIGTATGYGFVAAGDMNGDGKADMLFMDASGNFASWFLNDTAITGGGSIGNPGGSWTFKGLGDLNGDGKDDMLFQDASGMFASWDLDGATIVGGGDIGNPGGSWQLAKMTDLNQDGKADLVFVDAAGSYAAWLMDDNQIIGGSSLGSASGWHLV